MAKRKVEYTERDFMDDLYKRLGLNSSATSDEIRRAYRVLARRYHPDVNPGKASEEKFKLIAEAYAVLGDADKRKAYDLEHEESSKRLHKARIQAYEEQVLAEARLRQARRAAEESKNKEKKTPPEKKKEVEPRLLKKTSNLLRKLPSFGRIGRRGRQAAREAKITKISILEVSVSIRDAILGVKKSVEIEDSGKTRKVSVKLPPGIRTGGMVRLRGVTNPSEEIVILARVAQHPFLSIQPKGLMIEVPITLGEALNGASISVPTIEEPVMVKVPPGSQSGAEIRIKEKGIIAKDGKPGDLFVRLMIRLPESPEAHGLKDKAKELEPYYAQGIRQHLGKSIIDLAG